MRIVDFYVSGSDTSAVDLLVSLRKLEIETLPVVIIPSRVDCANCAFSERLSKLYIRLVLKLSRDSVGKRDSDNLKKQELLCLL